MATDFLKSIICILNLWPKCAHRPKISPCPLKCHCSVRWPHIRVAFRGGNGDIYIYLFIYFSFKIARYHIFLNSYDKDNIFQGPEKVFVKWHFFFCWSKRGVVCPISHMESAEHARLKCSYTGRITFILDAAAANISKHTSWIFQWRTSWF